MNYVTRLAGESGAPGYPLAIHGAIDWQRISMREFGCTLTLPEVPGGHIIVPSFSAPTRNTAFRFRLRHADFSYLLQQVPAVNRHTAGARIEPTAGADVSASTDHAVSNHIDCWHTHKTLRQATVQLSLDADNSSGAPPTNALVTLSVRPLQVTATPPVGLDVAASEPVAISQMQASASIRHRICSPTALTMALSNSARLPGWPLTIAHCFDPLTRAYGSWPLAIQWAAIQGRLGAVEVLPGWDHVPGMLATGQALVCSINYAAGHLTGGAIAGTGGHLVVLQAIEHDRVRVFDPAAATHCAVPRYYDLQEFSNAWLRERGAAYIFASHEVT